MDSITHAVMGACISGTLLGRAHGRKAYVAGAVLATLPDLDVLIRHANPVAAMISHRSFSHSLFVLTALAAVLAWGLRRWRPAQGYGASRLFLAVWLVLVTHPLLDAFTSYGTQLFWPFKPVPTSWSSLFIIDPFYTLPLLLAGLAGLIAGATPRTLRAAHWALGISVAYVALSIGLKATIEARVHAQLAHKGVAVQAMFSTPEPFSILLWRVVARTGDDHYIEAIAGVFDNQPAELIEQPLHTSILPATPILPWLTRLQWFTGNWLRYDEIQGQLIATDLRMGLGVGYYSFRFRLAERNPDGTWRAVVPTRWPSPPALDALWTTLHRIWREAPPLPLNAWARPMEAQ
ncbi:metal-dependent hydrolase [Paralcaligenes ureilyticus]|uniref:Inner membrane protein n=1 Tax=Paralcaligenes ureilyticus TaxID=627131 RepID=A0A4R3LYA0_9BURK|nr:metal-dependent hydrolase [Paralcaligenes ureilyticus]TCT04789.1 inner membrane protein [Paralcaligenes ureilyticus]